MKYMDSSSWRKNRRWITIFSCLLGFSTIALAVAFYILLHIPDVSPSDGVCKYEGNIRLSGRQVKVDFYLPAGNIKAPAVILAHGFLRNRKTMAGWAAMLAGEGFIVAVPDLPYLADHQRNAKAISELMKQIQEGELTRQSKPSGSTALVGFSAGGFSTLLAARDNAVSCWVGLDPVGIDPMAEQAAGSLDIPCFILRAEPSPWNARGNAKNIFSALKGPAFSMIVKNASHADAENPTSLAAEMACGKTDPLRRKTFGQYLVASLRAAMLHDENSIIFLKAAANDDSLREVIFRNWGDSLRSK